MKYRVLSIVSLAVVLIVGMARDSNAQIDVGYYLLEQIASGGSSIAVGEVLVESNRIEHWHLYNDVHSSASLKISPRRRWDVPSHVAKARQFQPFQREIDVEPQTVIAWLTEPNLDDEIVARTIWQRGPGESAARFVGVLYTPSDSSLFTHRETWLLDEGYVYPSLDNGIEMELRPIRAGQVMARDELIAEASPLSIDRVITADFVEITADPSVTRGPERLRVEPDQLPACTASNEPSSGDPLGMTFTIVAVMTLLRRVRGKRG